MTYTVNYTNPGKTPIIIEDATANNSTSLTLIGRQYDQYGEIIAENFVKLLENFSYTSAPSNPTPGQIWHDTTTKTLKVFDSSGLWKPLSVVYNGTSAPSTTASTANGDLWVNTTTGQIFIYSGGEWKELAAQTQNSGIGIRTRVDTASTTHYTIEAVSNNETIFVISTEEQWTPADTEQLSDNSKMNLSFPIIYKGINFNSSEAYGIHNLSTTRIDVGRSNTGYVIIENNSLDAADDGTVGAGITLRTSQNPTNGSIFSVRSSSNTSRLWVGQEATTIGKNDFAVGFTGNNGSEYDLSLYNIKLGFDGDISAKSVSGGWLATNAQATAGTSNTKIITPATAQAAIDARFIQRISSESFSRASTAEATATPPNINTMINDKVMTPLRTREAINAYVPDIVTDELDGIFNDSSLTANGYQKFPNGLIIQWGTISVPYSSTQVVNFPVPLIMPVFSITFGVINTLTYSPGFRITFVTQTGFTASNLTERNTISTTWSVIGKWK